MPLSYLDAVDACYAALDDGRGLDEFTAMLGQAVGAEAGDIVSERAATGEVKTFGSFGFDPAYRESYDEVFVGVNPWVAALEARPGDQVYTDIEDGPDLRDSAYYNDWVRPQGLDRSAGARLSALPGRVVWVGFARAAGAPRFSGEEVDLLERLLPHLNRVVGLMDRLAPTQGAPLAGVREAALLVDADARIVAATPAAEPLIDNRRLFRTRDNRLALGTPRDGAEFRAALAQAVAVVTPDARPMPPEGLVCLAHDPAGGVTGLSLFPYSVTDPQLGHVRRCALVLLRDWDKAPDPDLRALALEFELTPTERDLVAHLAGGQALSTFAERRGMAVSTARWHLKNAEAKTGTGRAEQLVALAYRYDLARRGTP